MERVRHVDFFSLSLDGIGNDMSCVPAPYTYDVYVERCTY